MKLKDLVPLKEATPVNVRTQEYLEGWELDDLKDRLEQVYGEMEQEAEPEGGPIADEYADEITALEDAITIKKRGGVSMTSDYISKDAEMTYDDMLKKHYPDRIAKDKDTFTKSSKFDRNLQEQDAFSMAPPEEKTDRTPKYDKESLLKALGSADDAFIDVGYGDQYIIYNPNSNNQDNADMWGDDSVFAVDKDGEEHEIAYSEIASININEGSCGYTHTAGGGELDTPGGTRGMRASARTRSMQQIREYIKNQIKKLHERIEHPGKTCDEIHLNMSHEEWEKTQNQK